MKQHNVKAWLYLLPAILFLGAFMVYPLIDVFVYSFEEGFNSASQRFFGVGLYNYSYVLHDPYFLQAVKNTFILVAVTVPVSTGLALLISVGLSSIKKLRELYQTVYFLPYVTNTLAVGLVFMILFKKTPYTDGLANLVLGLFGVSPIDFIEGPYAARMFVLCFYTVWAVLPFKILILTSALAGVKKEYYQAARVDGTPRARIFWRITLPMISRGIFAGWMMIFIIAFRELVTASLIAPPNTLVVSTYINREFEQGSVSLGMAMAVLCVLITTTALLIFNRFAGKKKEA